MGNGRAKSGTETVTSEALGTCRCSHGQNPIARCFVEMLLRIHKTCITLRFNSLCTQGCHEQCTHIRSHAYERAGHFDEHQTLERLKCLTTSIVLAWSSSEIAARSSPRFGAVSPHSFLRAHCNHEGFRASSFGGSSNVVQGKDTGSRQGWSFEAGDLGRKHWSCTLEGRLTPNDDSIGFVLLVSSSPYLKTRCTRA